MLYTVLCYDCEERVFSWTREQDDAVMTRLGAVLDRLADQGKLAATARLAPTATARTLRKARAPFVVTDGPFAEAKEVILGFYLIDCASEDEAMAIARDLGEANPGGALEVRPVAYFRPGMLAPQPEGRAPQAVHGIPAEPAPA
jgi:hypothetical protein